MSQSSKTPEKWNPSKPFDGLPTLPPPDINLESTAILKACIKARAALAELKQAAELIPNQTMLINLIPLLEAKESSAIENIVTTTDRLFQFSQLDDEKADPATKEALRYSQSLLDGFKVLKKHPLNTRTAEEVCTTIKGKQMRVRKIPGTALVNDKTGVTVYTPPVGESLIRDLLANWERFLHDAEELDPLIRMAVGHYQFEAIHPFSDGNGRTGRVLNSLFLIQNDLLTLPILYLSRYFIQHKDSYYRLLSNVTKNQEWEDWVVFVLTGIDETSQWTRRKIEAIRNLQNHTAEFVKAALPNIYQHELVSLIFKLPYCRIQNLTEDKIAERQAASKYLKELVRVGVLKEIKIGREKLFLHPKLMKLLSDESNSFSSYAIPSSRKLKV